MPFKRLKELLSHYQDIHKTPPTLNRCILYSAKLAIQTTSALS